MFRFLYRQFRLLLWAAVLLPLPIAAQGSYSVLSGYLHGTEPLAQTLDRGCYNTPAQLGYDLVQPLTVSESGRYDIVSTGWAAGLDVYFAIYEGPFNPQQPEQNLLAAADLFGWIFDDSSLRVRLMQGVAYQLVTTAWCVPDRGVWTLVFHGAGEVNSPATITGLDAFQSGNFDGGAPTADLGCGMGEFHDSGPQQVSRSGTYYLVNASYFFNAAVCVGVYSGPFNPAQPNEGRVAFMDDYFVPVELIAGQDYYFVTSKYNPQALDDYFYLVQPSGYLVQPSGDVYFDPVQSGAWFNPETPGQGFFLDVMAQDNRIFLGWLTYDLERPETDPSGFLGDNGQRWLTASGTFHGAAADLDLYTTTGGVFDEPEPLPSTQIVGHLEILLRDCQSGEISYDLGSIGRSGVIPIRRISAAAGEPCENLMSKAGMPRPLNGQQGPDE